ncbi:2-methylaconitate cis-trans isomerase PrpF family protein [Bradyrhizobium sp. Bra78]|uniref:2-methylaconitate cis-trans isomerase PrpF family protein n=1 Tax=Bradyrhizobium sp. Bra78 TaxID=2926010 RepID=UPI0021C5AA8B|nr:PrpF domain-containing protein [Bradyrhizobium sp. Bra78]
MISRPAKLPAVFMRGGTSKGVFFHGKDLPTDPSSRDRVLLHVLGSPDPYGRQIDGLGGATSSTSKVAIIGPSARPDCDVDYLVGQVEIKLPSVDYSSNCGNLASAVGPFAIEEGLVAASEPVTEVRIWQANIRRRIIARVPTLAGSPVEEGGYSIDGIARPGAEITLDFLDPGGSATAGLLPTGRTVDTLDIPGLGSVRVSLVDATLPTVFVKATDVGLTGTELKGRIDGDTELLGRLEAIRSRAAVLFGLSKSVEDATRHMPAVPKIAFVAPPQGYRASDGRYVEKDGVDFVARILSMGALHHAYEVSGAIATAMAASIPGTIVNDVAQLPYERSRIVRIGHTSGTIEIGTDVERLVDGWNAKSARLSRTARRIMEGYVSVPTSILK